MRIKEIAIANYRQYRDMKFLFPLEGVNDLHVIVASNGIGKSNLLNALNWCFYGDEPHLNDASKAKPICNSAASDDALVEGRDSVNVSVSITLIDDKGVLIFKRMSEFMCKGSFARKSKLEVSIKLPSGDTEILSEEDSEECVNMYFPKRIREYFFFDGERLSNYFNESGRTKQVRASIHEIAQVNLLTKVKEHLEDVAKQYDNQCSGFSPEIARLEETIKVLEDNLEQAKAELEEAREQCQKAAQAIEAINKSVDGCESAVEDNKKYNFNLEKIKKLAGKRAERIADIESLIREYTILLNLYDALKGADEFITQRHDEGKLPPEIDRKWLQKSIDESVCALCYGEIGGEALERIQGLLEKLEFSNSASNHISQIRNDVADAVRKASKFPSARDESISALREIDKEIEDLEEENKRLSKNIVKVADVDEIATLLEDRKNWLHIENTNREKIGSRRQRIEDAQKELGKKKAALDKELEKAAVNEVIATYAKRTHQLCDMAAGAECEITKAVREQMEKVTFERFSELLSKSNTYDHVTLNHDYNLELWDRRGNSCLGSTSAAEHELLALAFTLAVHEVSGNGALLFIDTPVGRVSDENRRHFAEVLREVSLERQLILAFTPSELSEEVTEVLSDSGIARMTYLGMDDAEDVTKEV